MWITPPKPHQIEAIREGLKNNNSFDEIATLAGTDPATLLKWLESSRLSRWASYRALGKVFKDELRPWMARNMDLLPDDPATD